MGQKEKEENIELHNLKLESLKLFTTEKVVRIVEENPEQPLFLIEKVNRETFVPQALDLGRQNTSGNVIETEQIFEEDSDDFIVSSPDQLFDLENNT